jgi:hypothetical protein
MIEAASVGGLFHCGSGVQRNASAITASNTTITMAETAPAAILALSLEL